MITNKPAKIGELTKALYQASEANLTREQAERYDNKLFDFYRAIIDTAVALGVSSLEGVERGGSTILLAMLCEGVSTLRLHIKELRRKPTLCESLFRQRSSSFSIDDARTRYNSNVKHLNGVRSKLNLEHILYLTGV